MNPAILMLLVTNNYRFGPAIDEPDRDGYLDYPEIGMDPFGIGMVIAAVLLIGIAVYVQVR
jgi:hypothetical protein